MVRKDRPDPDTLLASIKDAEQRQHSRLKIFFGMCAGVGKTYAMLHEAGELRRDERDVKVGYVETHGRAETEALLKGLKVYPRGKQSYRDKNLEEFDLDAVLRDKPEIVLVDELAHTNAPGSRHPKRYQDVFELLDNGISVYTTLNVQHLESINEEVKAVTGVSVRETIPDEVLDRADEIELVDLTPAELLKRLSNGKVYAPDRSKAAIANFFTVSNLTALREQSLRVTGGHVRGELQRVTGNGNAVGEQKQHDTILLLITSDAASEQTIRWTRQMAYGQGCGWGVAVIDDGRRLKPEAEQQLAKNVQMARDLGGEVYPAKTGNLVDGLLRIAQQNDIGRIAIAHPAGTGLSGRLKWMWLLPLLSRSQQFDVLVYRSSGSEEGGSPFQTYREISIDEYLLACYGVLSATLVGLFLNAFMGYYAVALVLLMSIILLSLVVNGGAILFAALLSAVLWDVLFIPPRFHLTIGKFEDVLMLGMYLLTAVVAGTLTGRIRQNEMLNRQHETQLASLLKLTKQLVTASTIEQIIRIAVTHLSESFSTTVCVYLGDRDRAMADQPHAASSYKPGEKELGVASWVYQNRKPAGRFTRTLAGVEAQFLPLATEHGMFGVVGINLGTQKTLMFEEEMLLNGAIQQISAAMERALLIRGKATKP